MEVTTSLKMNGKKPSKICLLVPLSGTTYEEYVDTDREKAGAVELATTFNVHVRDLSSLYVRPSTPSSLREKRAYRRGASRP
ncbi:hypothetical protein ABTD62_20635, partial [Acinetobacter baumannii]